jgi:hypothetical protein
MVGHVPQTDEPTVGQLLAGSARQERRELMTLHTLTYWSKSKGGDGLGECSCKWRARGSSREVRDRHAAHVYEMLPKIGDLKDEPEGREEVPESSRR